MAKLVGISGSLRKGSFNTALLHTASEVLPEGTSLDIRTLHGIPLYNADDEAETGIPDTVIALRDAMVAADGVILSTPEYNNSIPGVFKNAIDWLSRQLAGADQTFTGRPFAIIGASPGGFGTILSQNGWLPVMRTLSTDLWTGGRLMVSRAGQLVGDDLIIHDGATRERLGQFIEGFVSYIDAR